MKNEVHEITVPTWRLEQFYEALEKYNRRLGKYDLPEATAKVVGRRMVPRLHPELGYKREFKVTTVQIQGPTIQTGNHEFVARVEFTTEGDRLFNVSPYVEGVSQGIRHRMDVDCDHCQTERPRRHLFVIRDRTTGAEMQIGRTCLRDYMGTDSASDLAARFNAIFEMDELKGFSDGPSSWGSTQSDFPTEYILTLAAASVRAVGWVPRSRANGIGSTADHVQSAFDGKSKFSQQVDGIRKSDEVLGKSAGDFILSEDFNGHNDYVRNMKLLVGCDRVTFKQIGMVASAIGVYLRQQEWKSRRAKVTAKSEHIGEVGERLSIKAKVVFKHSFEGDYGATLLFTFQTLDGVFVKWFGTGRGASDLWEAHNLQEGMVVQVTGRVKKCDEWKGQKQTIMTRCKWAPVEDTA